MTGNLFKQIKGERKKAIVGNQQIHVQKKGKNKKKAMYWKKEKKKKKGKQREWSKAPSQ